MNTLLKLCLCISTLALVAYCNDAEVDSTESMLNDIKDTEPAEAEVEGNEEENEHGEPFDLNHDEMEALHIKIDTNHDGMISHDEVIDYWKHSRRVLAQTDMPETIEELDVDKDGKVSEEEFLNNQGFQDPAHGDGHQEDELKKMEHKELDKAKFKVADKDGDGFLDRDELPMVVMTGLSDDIAKLQAADLVKRTDKDGDGMLSMHEFYDSHGEPDEDIALPEKKRRIDEFEKLDLDKNGKLNAEEVTIWESGIFHTADAMSQFFELADDDKDGILSVEEFQKYSPQLSAHEASSYFLDMWGDKDMAADKDPDDEL